MEITKEVVVIGLKKVEPEIQKQIVSQFSSDKQIVFLDEEMYNANLSAIHAKVLKIKGKFDENKFKSDPENIKNVEIWRNKFEEYKVTLFRIKDLVNNFDLKYADAKLLLIQLELFGMVVEDKVSGEGWFKFIPNDAARLFHLTEVLVNKKKECVAIEKEFEELKARLEQVEKKSIENEKQKVVEGYLKIENEEAPVEKQQKAEEQIIETEEENITQEEYKNSLRDSANDDMAQESEKN
jgi:hypothetical protein